MAGPWATTQGLHLLGAAIATPLSKSKASEERPGRLQTESTMIFTVPAFLLHCPNPEQPEPNWVMTLEIRVLVPALLPTSTFPVCKMGLIPPAILVLVTHGRHPRRT